MNLAIVTGASSGIGRSLLYEVDKLGYDEIWAIALEEDKLNEAVSTCKTKCRVMALDLTNNENLAKIESEIKSSKANISMLINCSGFGKFGRYDEVSAETNASMIELNCVALTKLCGMCIPYMSRGSKIMNIASVAALQPVPYISVYAATKAFVFSYSRSLNRELKNKGITVTAVCPFWTKTNFFDVAKKTTAECEVVSKYTAMYTPEFVARKAMRATLKGKDKIVVGFKSKMQALTVKVLPHSMVMSVWIKQQKLDKKYKNK